MWHNVTFFIEADKTGIAKEQVSAKLKRTDADNDRYEKSKLKLHHGILSGMTTREVDEKIGHSKPGEKTQELQLELKTSRKLLYPNFQL